MTQTVVRLRPAEREDATAIAAILRASFEAALPRLAGLHTPQEDLAFVQSVLLKTCTVTIADIAGVAAGFIALSQAAGGPGVLGQIGNFSEGLLASMQSVGDGFRGLFGETGKDLVSITAFGILAASLVWIVFGKRDD